MVSGGSSWGCSLPRWRSVRVNANVVDEIGRGKDRCRVGITGPVAADSQIQDDEHRSLVEGPGAGDVAGIERLVGRGWIVNVELDLAFGPDHAVGVPGGSGERGVAIGRAAVEISSVHRGLVP